MAVLEKLTPITKRRLGLAMTVVAGVTTTGWAWSSFAAGELVGSPYLWAVVLFVYFTGITLIGASWPVPDHAKASRRMRQWLVLHFLVSLLAMGLLFLVLHVAIGGHPPVAGQKYTPWTVLGALLSYIPFYYFRSHPANLKGMGTMLVPLLYFIGQAFAPIAFIEYYNTSTQRVETVDSIGDMPSATSGFLAFRKLEIVPRYALDYEYHFVESDGRHHVSYEGLLPVNTGRSDTLFTTWLDFSEDNYFSASVSKEAESEFFSRNRERMLGFTLDSAVFFDFSKLSNRTVLQKYKYPLTDQAVVLIPVSTPLENYIGGQHNENITLTCMVILFFWIASVATSDQT